MYTAAVITVSDKGARGEREDTSGPNLCRILEEKGFDVVHTAIVPDDAGEIQRQLLYCSDNAHIALVLTTGGTRLFAAGHHAGSHPRRCGTADTRHSGSDAR